MSRRRYKNLKANVAGGEGGGEKIEVRSERGVVVVSGQW